jgi:hypothetical protein
MAQAIVFRRLRRLGRPQTAMVCPTGQQSRNQNCGARSLARHAGSPAGGPAGIAGLAARSTSGKSLREEKILCCYSTGHQPSYRTTPSIGLLALA